MRAGIIKNIFIFTPKMHWQNLFAGMIFTFSYRRGASLNNVTLIISEHN